MDDETRGWITRHSLAIADIDDKITKLAAMQIVTEQKLQGLTDALKNGGNGRRPE